MFYLYSLIMAIELLVAGIVPMPREILNSLIFVPLLDGPVYHWPIHYLGWTLAFEWLFYLVVALLILNDSRWRTRSLMLVLLVLPFGSLG
ncbi:MAG: hypothetical protein R3E68_15370 [Burkholderiaceae bacterium]